MMLNKRILIGYGVIFTLLGMVVAWSIINTIFLVRTTNTILYEKYRNISAAESMIDALERQECGILLVLLNRVQDGITQFRQNEANFLKWLARTKDNIKTQEEKKLVNEIEHNYTTIREQFSAITDFPDSENHNIKSSFDTYHDAMRPLFNE
ncbi:MAG: PAS domain-containing sensor histidine kinase, partial [Desulfobacteraceae bacterium]